MNDNAYRIQYVDVLVMHKRDGSMEIQEITWTDGRKFKVTSSQALGYASAPHTGMPGKGFMITIGNQKRMIYLQKDKFFMETKCQRKPTDAENNFGFTEEEVRWMTEK